MTPCSIEISVDCVSSSPEACSFSNTDIITVSTDQFFYTSGGVVLVSVDGGMSTDHGSLYTHAIVSSAVADDLFNRGVVSSSSEHGGGEWRIGSMMGMLADA
jgi:hypothetical protein